MPSSLRDPRAPALALSAVCLFAGTAHAQPVAKNGKTFIQVDYEWTLVTEGKHSSGILNEHSTLRASVHLKGWVPGRSSDGVFTIGDDSMGLLEGTGSVEEDSRQTEECHGTKGFSTVATSAHRHLPVDLSQTSVSVDYGTASNGDLLSHFVLHAKPQMSGARLEGTMPSGCETVPIPAAFIQLMQGWGIYLEPSVLGGAAGQMWLQAMAAAPDKELSVGQFVKEGNELVLRLDKTFSQTKVEQFGQTVMTQTRHVNVTVSGEPPANPELLVEARDYARWLPSGNDDSPTQPGSALAVTATLRQPDGTSPKKKVFKIIFELLDVSKEPGTCLNQPPKGNGPLDYDLAFRKDDNPGLIIADATGQRAVSQDGKTLAVASVSSFDWGAYGTLKVTAELVDGTVIVGKLKGDSGPGPILLPKRTASSHIATAWKEDRQMVQAADDDDLNTQDGNEKIGDGFTLYEEYRGVRARGKHVSLDPKKKNLLVENKVGASGSAGIALFASAASLNVVELAPGELGESRVVNANHQTAHGGEQHGLRLELHDFGADGSAESDTAGLAVPMREGSRKIPSPKECKAVWVTSARPAGMSSEEFTENLAHELAHGCGVSPHHHGDSPSAVGPSWVDATYELYDADGLRIPAAKLIKEGGADFFVRNHVASPFSESSGDVDCLMTYNHLFSASQPDPAGRPKLFILVGDFSKHPRTTFCRSAKGTRWNAPGHKPLPIFGDARTGNCQGQFNLKDW